jgi:(2R)-3-sulfolactate dehydrogenase (NADP+)
MATIQLAEAEDLVARALLQRRTSEANARCVAQALIAAEADGLKGHGLSRVPTYGAQAESGKVDGFATPRAQRARAGVVQVDAANGFAFPALDLAVCELPAAVRENGIAAAAITRSHHCGAAGHPVERLAERGLVAMLFANTPAAIAPWGGNKALFGTNPLAFACPLPGRAPLVIDIALSKVARGNILAAKQRGEPIPESWALDANGQPTTDPDAALAGTMLPTGDAKGAALALMVELLAAGLVGANYAAEVSSFLDAQGAPPGTGQLILAIDPAAFSANAVARFGVLAEAVETQAGARLPGARRLQSRRDAAMHGLSVPDTVLAEIRSLAEFTPVSV